ncbi:MAG: hypothetical protein EAZ62_04105, partial [Sphingobacteriia bacterium]
KKRLTDVLSNYWDDSLRVPKVQQWLFWYKIKKPPVFDTLNLRTTANFMRGYLQAEGYYYADFTPRYSFDTLKDQVRTSVVMAVETGKNIRIDSISYDLSDSALQSLTLSVAKDKLLKKGEPYNKQIINRELDRLVSVYRRNGYYRQTREDIYALVDTLDAPLLKLTLDPFEQLRLFELAAARKKQNPAWDITIKSRTGLDSNRTFPYYIGNLIYYPETKLSDVPENLMRDSSLKTWRQGERIMRYREGKFILKPMRNETYFKKGDLYNEEKYFTTTNALTRMGAWQSVDIRPEPRGKDTLDMHFFMVPAVKQSYSVNLEGSYNTADIGITNLIGISTNFTYTNRNLWKRAIQGVVKASAGVELNVLNNKQPNSDLFQTYIFNGGYTFVFPKLIQPFDRFKGPTSLENRRTLLSINAAYVDRKDFYLVRNTILSWGYEWKKKQNSFLYRPLNIELYNIEKRDSLKTLIQNNPFLQASFNEGNILSQSFSFLRTTISPRNPNKSRYFRLGIEEAGGIFGLLPGFNGKIYRYLKTEMEFRQSIKYQKTELALRAYGGLGYNYGGDTIIGPTMPFFKQFSAGGPNSMRAWRLRQLGLGSSNQSEQDTAFNAFRDRFGDMQLEWNIEYRFPLVSFGSMKVGSALYADLGNVWNIRKVKGTDPLTLFNLSRFGQDLAIGLGTGLRLDFSYFLIRLDFAYKVKDPLRTTNKGWMSFDNFEWSNTRPNGVTIPNYAIQFGIGLPF